MHWFPQSSKHWDLVGKDQCRDKCFLEGIECFIVGVEISNGILLGQLD